MKYKHLMTDCPKCKSKVRRDALKKFADQKVCLTCWRSLRMAKLGLPEVKVEPISQPKRFVEPSKLGLKSQQEKEKRLGRITKPIKKVEENLLFRKLQKEGLAYGQIRARIDNLKEQVVWNHKNGKCKEVK